MSGLSALGRTTQRARSTPARSIRCAGGTRGIDGRSPRRPHRPHEGAEEVEDVRGRTTPSRDRRRAVRVTAVDRRAQRAAHMIGSGILDRTGRPREGVVPPCSSAPGQSAWKVRGVKERSSVSTPIEPPIVLGSELVKAIVSKFETVSRSCCWAVSVARRLKVRERTASSQLFATLRHECARAAS